MPTLSHRALEMQESAIRKLDATVALQTGVRFHRLNIGQPDVPTPQPLIDAIRGYAPAVIAYGPASGTADCRAAAAAYARRWCPSLEASDVVVTQGGSEALLFAFTAVCDPGDEILVPEPYYTNYNGFATVAGARVRPIATRIKDGFALPSDEALDRLVTPRTKVLVLNSPGNPTGIVYSRAEYLRAVRWAARHDLFVVADEVYRRIWFDAEPTSALEFEAEKDNVIVVDSLSKTWSACGIRLGFLYARNPALMERIERLGQARLGPQPLAQAVGVAALTLPEPYYAQVRQVYAERVAALYDALAEIGLAGVPRPQGAFYLMAELPVADADDFARFLVTDFRRDGESVVVAPGSGFYANPADGKRQIRLAAVSDPATLRHAVGLIGHALAEYRG